MALNGQISREVPATDRAASTSPVSREMAAPFPSLQSGFTDEAAIEADSPTIEIVAITTEQHRKEMVALFEEGFPDTSYDWSIAFDSPAGESGHGVLLLVDGKAEGALLCFEKKEVLNSSERRIVNLARWYVRKESRRYAVRMGRALIEDSEAVFTACTPITSVKSIGRRLGFRQLSPGSITSLPLINGVSSPEGIEIQVFDSSNVDPECARWFSDHNDSSFFALTIHIGEQKVPVLFQRGLTLLALPAIRLIYTLDYAVLEQAMPAIHFHLLLRHRIFGIYLPNIPNLSNLVSVRSRESGPSIIVRGDIADEEVNLLYSELKYLPHTRRPMKRRLTDACRLIISRSRGESPTKL